MSIMEILVDIWSKTGRKVWYKVFDKPPFVAIGSKIYPLLPERVVKKAINVGFKKRSFWAELVIAGHNEYYKKLSNEKIEELNRKLIWGGEAYEWHLSKLEEYKKDFDEKFLKYKINLINELKKIDLKNFNIVEIGCGNGVFLEYLSKNIEANRYIGFDISKEIIEFNKKYYKNNHLEFYSIDIYDFIKLNMCSNTVFITSGVLMYFTQEFLENLIKDLKNEDKRIIFALNEIVTKDFDKQKESVSNARFAYNHNYKYLFEKYNWEIMHYKYISKINRVDLIAKNKE